MPAGVASGGPPPTMPPPPAARPRSRRFAGRGGLAALGIAIVVIAAKVLLFSGAVRLISVATTATYHEPSTIAGDAKSSDAGVLATVADLQKGIELPALQGAHTEGAGYTDAAGTLDYLSVLAQDNANNDSPRQNVNLNSLFGALPGTELSPSVTSNFNGVNLECATITDVSGTTDIPINACDWYNSDAFGLFVEYKTATLAATQQLETSVLEAMTK
jgi:hypothetical protein